MSTKNITTKADLSKLDKEELIELIEMFDIAAGITLDHISESARSDIHQLVLKRFVA